MSSSPSCCGGIALAQHYTMLVNTSHVNHNYTCISEPCHWSLSLLLSGLSYDNDVCVWTLAVLGLCPCIQELVINYARLRYYYTLIVLITYCMLEVYLEIIRTCVVKAENRMIQLYVCHIYWVQQSMMTEIFLLIGLQEQLCSSDSLLCWCEVVLPW